MVKKGKGKGVDPDEFEEELEEELEEGSPDELGDEAQGDSVRRSEAEPDGLGMLPRPGEPESSMLPGMAARDLELPAHALFLPALLGMPDTSIGAVALQEPAQWSYDFDPGTGVARASYPGEVSGASGPAVTSFNTRTGAVTLQAADVTGVGGALTASPTLTTPTLTSPTITGISVAPTAAPGTNTTQLATTAFAMAAAAAAGTPTRQVLTAASGTYNTPVGCKAINVRMVGAGGGGGGAPVVTAGQFTVGSGGGSGAYCEKLIAAPLATYAYGNGTGGTGGNPGGSATFGTSLLTAPGGLAGVAMGSSQTAYSVDGGGPATPATGGDLNLPGGCGMMGVISGLVGTGGPGGASFFGGGGIGAQGFGGAGANGTAAINPGSGGGGAANNATGTPNSGGSGASGIIIVDEYY